MTVTNSYDISYAHVCSPCAAQHLPQVIKGSTMVPMRAIFDALGATVRWDGATMTITATKDATVVVLRIGNRTATINGNPVTLNEPAVIISGSTLVPLRFVSDALGATVRRDGATRTVIITNYRGGYAPTTHVGLRTANGQ